MSIGRFVRGARGLVIAAVVAGCGGESNPPPLPEGVFLFAVAKHDGNLGGRSGADDYVSDRAPARLAGKEVHAFLSVSATDELADMPANYAVPTDLPVYGLGPDGPVQLAAQWSGLFDDQIDSSLDTALGVASSDRWWSGSQSNGSVASANCSGWTTTAGTGSTGVTSNVSVAAFDDWDGPGTGAYYVLGVAY